jgi:light-harvesting complex I chlorophyll a/b binding protein 1
VCVCVSCGVALQLKHGRVAMLATVGWLWTATGAHFEGMLSTSKGISFADCAAAGNPIAAAAKVPGAGVWQMIFAIGALEVFWENKYPANECAGNFGVPAVTQDPAKLKELQTIELKHGRLAMIGIISFATATSLPGSVPFYPF